MNPGEKTPKQLVELADTFYRSMQYEIASTLYAAATAKALVIIIEDPEAPKAPEVAEAPKAPKAKRSKAA